MLQLAGQKKNSFSSPLVIGLAIGVPIAFAVFFALRSKTASTRSTAYTMAEALPVAQPQVTYKNLEEWEFIKNGDGRVTGVRVHRTATQEA